MSWINIDLAMRKKEIIRKLFLKSPRSLHVYVYNNICERLQKYAINYFENESLLSVAENVSTFVMPFKQ